jgi:pilus assembly protein FimV
LAFGLGDIQVQSALGQPLTAQIELVGASADDLAGLRATIADDETFQRHGLERPSFLSTIVMTVGKDTQQRPVLLLHSSETFVEPMATFLVGLHSPSGELIREYTILLDPPGLTRPNSIEAVSAVDATAAVDAAASVEGASAPTAQTAEAVRQPSGVVPDTYSVARGDTLDRIVRVAGAHSRSDRRRMMLAIFRANPAAFGSNVNVLHSGAILRFPSAAQLSAISADEANHEVAEQMSVWRAPGRRRPARSDSAPAPASAVAQQLDTGAGIDAHAGADEGSSIAALNERVAIAEKSLDQMRQELNRPLVSPTANPIIADSAPAADVTTNPAAAAEPVPASRTGVPYVALAIGLGVALILAGSTWFYRRRRDTDSPPEEPKAIQAAPPVRRRRYHLASSQESSAVASSPGRSPSLDDATVEIEVSLMQQDAGSTAVMPRIEAPRDSIDQDFLELNDEPAKRDDQAVA